MKKNTEKKRKTFRKNEENAKTHAKSPQISKVFVFTRKIFYDVLGVPLLLNIFSTKSSTFSMSFFGMFFPKKINNQFYTPKSTNKSLSSAAQTITVTSAIAERSEMFPHRAAPPQRRRTKCRLSHSTFFYF